MVNNDKSQIVSEIPHNQKRIVGVFKDRSDLEALLRNLKDSNFDMSKVSLIARNIDEVEGAKEVTEQEGNEAKEGAAAGATTGTVLGGLGGFLVGVGLLAVPGVGPILAAGAEISALASTLAGAGIGAASGGIIGALVGLGIPEEKAKIYNERVKAGNYLVMITGTPEEINRADSMMRDHHVEDFDIFDATDVNNTTERENTNENVETTNTVVLEREEIRSEQDYPRKDSRSDYYPPNVIIVDRPNHPNL